MREIIFFDLETTGVDTKTDRIVEISMICYNGREQKWSYTKRVNPGVPIPKGASDVHGITDDVVKYENPFAVYAPEILELLGACDIGGFNSNRFDVPILFNEMLRAGERWNWKAHRFIDVGNIFKIKERRTLEAASLFYLNKPLDNAHSAEADVICTAEVFFEMVDKYELGDIDSIELMSNFDQKVADLNRYFSYNDNDEIILNFGKHKGELAANNRSYIQWMYGSDFPSDTKEICKLFL